VIGSIQITSTPKLVPVSESPSLTKSSRDVSERGFHREVGTWLAETLPPNVQIVGDGYGYVSASALWAGRRAEPRMWTDDKEILANSVGDNAVLILYERYLREANPELLSSLDDGLPGMIRIVEFDFPRIGRVQAWRHIDVVEHVREKRRGTVGVVDSISQRNILKRASTPANALIPGDEI
jgi:hypothetical protein